MKIYLAITSLLLSWSLGAQDSTNYITRSGKVSFHSNAPLEFIKATSNELAGRIVPTKNTFEFQLVIKSFQGFNSAMQQNHFNENYMESKRFPVASFSGRIIEKVDLQKNGVYSLRAKGKFNVHGIERERIIKCTLSVEEGRINLESRFSILLEEHGIQVPKIIRQKIAEEVFIEIAAQLQKRPT